MSEITKIIDERETQKQKKTKKKKQNQGDGSYNEKVRDSIIDHSMIEMRHLKNVFHRLSQQFQITWCVIIILLASFAIFFYP